MFEANLTDNLRALRRDLKTGSFEPFPLRRVLIPKNETEFRPLGIPAVRDRVAQEVVRRLLSPIFEPLFHPASYGFRPGRNCHRALAAVLKLHEEGFRSIVDADIQGFFDNLRHQVIMQAVAERVADGNILRLVEKFLTSGVMDNGIFKPTTIGTPQGGVISSRSAGPTLSSTIWMGSWRARVFGLSVMRMTSSSSVRLQTRPKRHWLLCPDKSGLAGRLDLRLSREKTQVTSLGKGYQFLGFSLRSHSRRMRPKSVKKFKDKIRELTCRKHNLDAVQIEQLNRVIRGTAQYFATDFFTGREVFHKLDSWIRMRLRCMKAKRKSTNDPALREPARFIDDGKLLCSTVMIDVPKRLLFGGNHFWGRPVRERRTPVNEGN